MTQDEIVDGLRTAGYTGTYNDMVVAYLREKSGLTKGAYNDLMVQTYGTSTVNDAEALFLADAEDGFALTVPDPLFANVTFLSNYTSDFSDVKGNTVTAFGNSGITGGAVRFDGVGDYLRVANAASLELLNDTYCIEAIVSISSLAPAIQFLVAKGDSALTGTTGLIVFSNKFQFRARHSAGGTLLNATMPDIVLNQQYHVAGVREGTGIRIYIDGTLAGSTTMPATLPVGDTVDLMLGGAIQSGNVNIFSYTFGDLFAVRITKGNPRYTANFTPPTFFPES